MEVTGVREFRSRATQLLGGKDLVFVTRHGKLASVIVPMRDPHVLPVEIRHELLERIGEAISSHLEKSGVTEKRMLNDFANWRAKRRANRRRR